MQTPDNLAEVSIEHVADLVEQGLKQLGEIPAVRRSQVEDELKRRGLEAAEKVEAELAEAKKATKKKPKAKKDASKK